MEDRSLGRTLRNLLIACINATLILIAICLFLGWKMASTINEIPQKFASSVEEILPIRDDLQDIRAEVAGLREELAAARAGGDGVAAAVLEPLSDDVAALDARLATFEERLDALQADPSAVIDRMIAAAREGLDELLMEVQGCTPTTPT
jgi:chromosome segregation ATPase